MRFRVYVFALCFVVSILWIASASVSKDQPVPATADSTASDTVKEVAFAQLEQDGVFPEGKIHFDEWAWSGAFLPFKHWGRYSAYLPFMTPENYLSDEKTVRILYAADFSQEAKEADLEKLVESIVPTELEGCAKSLSDDDVFKELVRAGFTVKMPMIVVSACPEYSEPVAGKGSPGLSVPFLLGITCTLLWLFGVFRFIQVFRAHYLSRRREIGESLDNRIVPASVSVNEGVRAAKTGLRHWSLLKESFLDAVCHYAPSMMTARLIKTAIPKEFAKVSFGVFREMNQARREGRFKGYLVERLRDPLASSINIYAALIALQILLARSLAEFMALTGLGTFILSWHLATRRCGLRARKGFSAAFCLNFVTMSVISLAVEFAGKEGVLLKLPFFSEYAKVVYFDLLSFPWVLLTAIVGYAVAAFIFRFGILFFRDKVEVSLGEQRVSLSDNEKKE
ncbi:hypothetical protein Q9Q94_10065 [Uliginosibacterium sp. 31-16]|uniref:hypothetical protein n=1 Tax=Uliginosibacterium sp. 31-16 TaxID=3068315 RepID=UPI00273DF68B|nr:hypothetical protein [Uliginosibacterium sp. 31-16]MDP5239879.1 hypothetical protein [Uliginosibacterium sp. 31-16]